MTKKIVCRRELSSIRSMFGPDYFRALNPGIIHRNKDGSNGVTVDGLRRNLDLEKGF